MHDPSTPDTPPTRHLGSWALIAAVMAGTVGAFGYVGGWLAPHRLTPKRIVNQFQHNAATFAGYRRNHAKGVCVTAYLDSNGQAVPNKGGRFIYYA